MKWFIQYNFISLLQLLIIKRDKHGHKNGNANKMSVSLAWLKSSDGRHTERCPAPSWASLTTLPLCWFLLTVLCSSTVSPHRRKSLCGQHSFSHAPGLLRANQLADLQKDCDQRGQGGPWGLCIICMRLHQQMYWWCHYHQEDPPQSETLVERRGAGSLEGTGCSLQSRRNTGTESSEEEPGGWNPKSKGGVRS